MSIDSYIPSEFEVFELLIGHGIISQVGVKAGLNLNHNFVFRKSFCHSDWSVCTEESSHLECSTNAFNMIGYNIAKTINFSLRRTRKNDSNSPCFLDSLALKPPWSFDPREHEKDAGFRGVSF